MRLAIGETGRAAISDFAFVSDQYDDTNQPLLRKRPLNYGIYPMR